MSKKHRHESSTIEQLECNSWGEPTYPSHLVTECHRLRRVPLGEFTVENLRIMIGQGIGLPFLMPLAVARLRDDPLAEGMHFPGDLLCAVLRVDPEFWTGDATVRSEVEGLAKQALRSLDPEEKVVIRASKKPWRNFRVPLRSLTTRSGGDARNARALNANAVR